MKKQIVVSLAFLFAIFAAGAGIASWYVTSTTRDLRRLLDLHEVEGLRRNLVISLQTVQGDLFTAHTPLAEELDEIVANVAALDDAADECASCHHRPEVEADLAELLGLIAEYEEALSAYITASANRQRIERIEREAAGIGEQILERTDGMSARARGTLDRITERAATRIQNVRTILFITLAITVCLGIAVSSRLVRSVTDPVGRLVHATRTIASGNLGHRIEDKEEAEFAELARHFNAMSTALQKSYEELKSANLELQREIGERRQAERDREELQKQLLHAHKMEALGALSAGIAHEFGNFLQIIQGCVERLASQRGGLGPAQRELDMIANAAQRAADMTRRLLAFGSKVENKAAPIDMNETVRNARTILERTLPESIEIEIHLADDIPLVEAEPAQIEQVLLNMAVNARDAMPEGGLLRIETLHSRAEGRRTGKSPVREAEEWIVLRISDTGHGMDEETVQQIFDPFFTTKAAGAGTGLGLATVDGIVTAYGGRITCSSRPGRGTLFEIHLPALPPEAARAGTKGGEGGSGKRSRPGGKTILLVDDETVMLEVMRDNLADLGYVVHTAESGERAIEFFREHSDQVDLVVLDVGMPGMGGPACLEKLLEIAPAAKVIMSTGHAARREEEQMRRAGARGFLAKPYQLADMLSEIERVLGT